MVIIAIGLACALLTAIAGLTDFRIRLTKEWSDEDENTYEKGAILKVDEETYNELIESGVAEKVAKNTRKVQKVQADDEESVADVKVAVAEGIKEAMAEQAKNLKRPDVQVVKENIEDDPKRGFKSFGDFLSDVVEAGSSGNVQISKSLQATKAVGSDEYQTISDEFGGFLIPPEFRQDIFTKGVEENFVRKNNPMIIPTGPATMVNIPAEVDVVRNGSTGELFGGINVFWQKEAASMSSSRGKFEGIELKPKSLTGLAYVTDRALFAIPQALGAILSRQFADRITYKELQGFLKGDGAGEPLGITSSGNSAKFEVSKEDGQAKETINTLNILTMRSHMRPREYAGAIWYTSNSCMAELNTLSITVGTAGAPIAMIQIGADGIERIMGRPLLYTEHAEALGTSGDIVLASFPAYAIAESSHVVNDSSIHVRFESNETAFRFVRYLDGQPLWRTTLTLVNSYEVAPTVTLATRA